MRVKRLRWSAVLLGLLLATSWAGAAQATTTSDTTATTVGDTTSTTSTTVGDTTTTTVGGTTTTTTVGGTTTTTTVGGTTTTTTVGGPTTTTTEPAPGEKPCSADEGLASHSAISVDKSSAHPSASVRFTVKEDCEVLAFLASGKFTDDSIEDVDFAPQDRSPLFGPGDYELTVRLPDCADFIVDFFVLEPPPEAAPTMMAQARSEADQAMTEGQGPLAPGAIEEVVDTTTNCPTETTNAKAVTTTVGGGQLPGTGANALPLLIAGLVLVVGGAAALLASRMRSRRAK
jgi:hypothetical protein